MSNLVKRGVPLAWGDWRDFDSTFQHPEETPLASGWNPSNSPTPAYSLNNELVFAGGSGAAGIPGSWSYEFQPFTANWGIEFDYKATLNLSGAQNGTFYALVGGSWTTRNVVSFFFPPTSLAFRLFHQNPVSGSVDRVELYRINENSLGSLLASADLPGGSSWWGSWHSIRVWFDADKDVRVWIDGQLMIFYTLPSNVRASDGARAFNFIHQIQSQLGYLRNFRLYDRVYDRAWSSVFYDDFNRANGAVGNGWTVLGSNSSIQSNSYTKTGTTDGSSAILRDSGISNGRVRVEGVVGGSLGINNNADSSLIACSNAIGTQGLSANIFGNKVYISRFSSALSGNPPSFTDLASQTSGVSISNGDTIAFNVRDGIAWIEQNGDVILHATNVHAVVPATNQYAGARVERVGFPGFTNSNSWNSIRLLQAA